MGVVLEAIYDHRALEWADFNDDRFVIEEANDCVVAHEVVVEVELADPLELAVKLDDLGRDDSIVLVCVRLCCVHVSVH